MSNARQNANMSLYPRNGDSSTRSSSVNCALPFNRRYAYEFACLIRSATSCVVKPNSWTRFLTNADSC